MTMLAARRAVVLLAAIGAAAGACSSGSTGPRGATLVTRGSGNPKGGSGALTVTSPAFAPGGRIPVRYTCSGDNVSPPLRWAGTPPAARELAVAVLDPDAPSGTFTLWVLAGLAPTLPDLDVGQRPPGAVEARGSSGEVGYTGPCPPDGKTHHYRFIVYALGSPSGLAPGAPASAALATITTRAIATGELVGTFGR
jgi:Raf kinase inhibitor-like YbhB/YbcL family protein